MKNGLRRFLFALLIAIIISGNLFQGISAGPQADKAAPEVGTNPETGKVAFIGGGAPIAIPGASGVRALSPQDKAMVAAELYGPQFGLKDPSQELSFSKTTDDGNGHAITRYQQVYQGIPVLAGELIFNMNTNGDLLSASGEVSSDLSLDIHPAVSGDAAGQTALGAVAKWYKVDASSLSASKPELTVYDESLLKASTRPPELVWRTEVTSTQYQPIREMVLLDAQTGGISWHINEIDNEGVSQSSRQNVKHAPDAPTTETPATTSAPAEIETNKYAPILSKPSRNPSIVATTWYVATTGNDSNSCTAAGSPCLTINGALGKAAASGDVINVASGTYAGSGSYVFTITKSIQILGGWNAAFTTRTGQTIIDGQAARSGMFIHGTSLAVNISQITVQNSAGAGGFVAVNDDNAGGTINFTRVALVNNIGNGLYNLNGNVNFTNSTISGNHSNGFVGTAISNNNGNINIQFSTITNNSATGTYAIYSGDVGAQVEMGNSILAGNTPADCSGNITSDGHNIFGRSPACQNTITIQPSDQVGIDPQISLLTPGGYHALFSGSPAINAANPATCPSTDQRGAARPFGAGCDIGAYEYIPAGPATSIFAADGSGQVAGFNQPLLTPLSAFVADGNGTPVSGATVTFAAPASGASGTFSDSGTRTTTSLTNTSGFAAAASYTANASAGTYNIAATTTGVVTAANFPIANQELFVAPTGNDSSNCLTPGTACLTIDGAIGKASSGAGIRIATGIYTGPPVDVVDIDKNISLSGGWNPAFTSQTGFSTVDGQHMQAGISIGIGLTVVIDHFIIQNTILGLALDGDTLTLTNSIVQDNSGSNTVSGIYSFSSTLTINNTSINSNSGGVAGTGMDISSSTVTITNSTIWGNHGGAPAGGIDFESGNLTISNSTIANNRGGVGGIFNTLNGTATIHNTILADNTALDLSPSDCNSLTSLDYNIIGTTAGCSVTAGAHDQFGVDPVLSSAAAGSLSYVALLAGSPAINAADPATCSGTDERGVSRPQGSACDIGAYEYQPGTTPASVTVFRGSPQIIQTGTAAATNLAAAVADANGAGVPGITVTFTAPASGASGIFSGTGTNITTAITGFNGLATASTFTTNSTPGPYSIQATVSGLPTPAVFSITNIPPVSILTYTMNHSSDQNALPGTFVCNLTQPVCTSGSDADVNHATQYAYDTYAFYQTHFQRNSIDNAGMPIISSVHFGANYANAFWNGSQMVYGDGFAVDDVVGHELTHGVTDTTSQLIYAYQSGAIDESLSDVFGEFIDQTDGAGNDLPAVKWLIGEDLPNGAIRSMSNPPVYSQPDYMTSPYFFTGNWDNGGVHINSGVNNKAAFLMTDGGSFSDRTVTGIGLNKTAAIYYEVQTNFLGAGANYSDLYFALQQACLNLTGGSDGITSADCAQVQNVIDAVQMNIKPDQAFTPNPDACDAGEVVYNTQFSDNMESGTGNWGFGSITGGNLWSFQTPGLASPTHSMVGVDAPTVHDSVAAMTSDILVPMANTPMLYFKHFFELDSFYDPSGNLLNAYDGGVVEYSTNHGATWQDALPLFDAGQNYNGQLSAGFSNPLGGRWAFSGFSHGMVASRYNLSNLQGQTVRFRWRLGTDDSVGILGWVIDDVNIYTCVNHAAVDVLVGGVSQGSFVVQPFQSTRQSFAGVNNGPVRVTSTNNTPIIASERVAYTPDGGTTWPNYSELMGLPVNQLTTVYVMPWYNNADLNTQIRFGNVGIFPTTVTVRVAGVVLGTYPLAPNQSARVSYPGLNNGPVVVSSSGVAGVAAIIASERVAYTPDGGTTWTGFSELMGFPAGQLSSIYVMPWYNNVDLNTQLRFGNAGMTDTTVTVTVAGVVQGTYPLAPNQSARVSYTGLNNGPVVISSSGGVPIIASQRVAYYNGSAWTSFTELMGLPASQITTSYVLPVYNNANLNTQLRFANVGVSPTNVTVTVGGVMKGFYLLNPNQSLRVSYAGLNNGPVVVSSSGGVPIIASQRVAYYNGSAWTNFAEMMGLPSTQLTTSYVMPWYNNADLNTQLRFGVP